MCRGSECSEGRAFVIPGGDGIEREGQGLRAKAEMFWISVIITWELSE